eukprot:CAMPEP_0206605526 /NCGR_PEP_ID=MMETSP0325_2-20121206/50498_1 /ASSEMBLY_ACC=CAM_ASM_000347 /TAXON_ID=2866 /ORGANISM="Crypthecodinium cohnii, Strain Seligo" /LENGTH=38 /DNA_ID= /DNA_START= /DNA_END= /DNA_ORIENTATION=
MIDLSMVRLRLGLEVLQLPSSLLSSRSRQRIRAFERAS